MIKKAKNRLAFKQNKGNAGVLNCDKDYKQVTANAIFFKRAFALLFSLALLFSVGFSGYHATNSSTANSNRVTGGTVSISKTVPNPDGSWQTDRKAVKAQIGDRESLTLPLNIGDRVVSGESLSITLDMDGLDPSTAEISVLIETNGNHLCKELAVKKDASSRRSSVSSELVISELFLRNDPAVSLLITAVRTQQTGYLDISVTKRLPQSLNDGAKIHIGQYTVSKQGAGSVSVQNAVGLSGMMDVDTVYIISKDRSELIRIMLIDDQILGLAINDRGLITGVEYDTKRKAYINTITLAQVLAKDELNDIFIALNCSFIKPPDEKRWIQSQDGYSWNKTYNF